MKHVKFSTICIDDNASYQLRFFYKLNDSRVKAFEIFSFPLGILESRNLIL